MSKPLSGKSSPLWYYLSFAGEDGFLGGAYVLGDTDMEAFVRAGLLGINPGGEVAIFGPIGEADMDEHVPAEDRERLLSFDELGPAVRV